MSLWTRFIKVFRGDRAIDEELESHIEEAIAGEHRDPAEARRAFGSHLRIREESRDVRVLAWLDTLRADAIFGWRQLWKNRITSAAAILSLALAIGSCTSAFRLIDALLLRPLPVSNPGQLYELVLYGPGFDGKPTSYDSWAYPNFTSMRDAVKTDADLIAISYSERTDLTFASGQEVEKAQVQYVSGRMFDFFGLKPAIGRLLTGNDDLKPGAHPYAILSHDYWNRRFGGDRSITGRTFHIGDTLLEIAGVVEAPYTGTEPGTAVDIFLPAMMEPRVTRDDSTWVRVFARVPDGTALEPIRARLDAITHAFEEGRLRTMTSKTKALIDALLNVHVHLDPAAAGASGLQHEYRTALMALGILVALVLFIACANVANLMTAQAASRVREMALRVSIGAGRGRLVQLVLMESAWIAFLAAAFGVAFAWWSAPFVVAMINPPDNPARLYLPWDWRVAGFGLALTLLVTFLFGLTPALRASSVVPASAMKGGADPHRGRRLMHLLIAAQVAFCFIVLFVAGLFGTSFERLNHRPLGFSPDRILTLNTVAHLPQNAAVWDQLAVRIRETPGVETAVLAGMPLLGGNSWNNFIFIGNEQPNPALAYRLAVSPGWLAAMKIDLLDGRDFQPADVSPGAAIVNESFARMYFNGVNPIGKVFQGGARGNASVQIVGLVKDAVYRNLREFNLPVFYTPFQTLRPIGGATILVRTSSANPLALAAALRQKVPAIRADFRVSNVRSQQEIVDSQTVRERLLAMLASFFAVVALMLAVIGLYGVLDYSVLHRRREIGIRMAIGAQGWSIAALVIRQTFAALVAGAVAGLGLGLAAARSMEALFFEVRATDLALLAGPSIVILVAGLIAAMPAVIHAVRVDPVEMLRSE